MTLEELQAEWDKDTQIDRTELGQEAIKIPQLHSKYYKIYSTARLQLRKWEAEYKVLKLEKYEFYTMGPTEESHEKGWVLPARGAILKAEVNNYMDADPDIIKASLKIGLQQEKIQFLEDIIKSLVNRGFQIKSAIDWERFKVGA
jgi:hypothetical protein